MPSALRRKKTKIRSRLVQAGFFGYTSSVSRESTDTTGTTLSRTSSNVERVSRKDTVPGSSPGFGSKAKKYEKRKQYYRLNRQREIDKMKEWRLSNPERHEASRRRSHLKLKYNLTPEEFSAAVIRQDGKCAICLNATEAFNVDHDHDTGVVRGLLCGSCNRAIGLLREDPAILLRASEYVTRGTSMFVGSNPTLATNSPRP